MDSAKLEMIPIPLSSFLGGGTAHVDVYLEVGAANFVKVFNAGDAFDLERLQSYKNHASIVYVTAEDYPKHSAHCISLATAASLSNKIPEKLKIQLISKTMESVYFELHALGVSQSSLKKAMEVNNEAVKLADKMSVGALINNMAAISEKLLKHSIAVSTISVILARHLGWKSTKVLTALSLSGFLHDIGFRELPKGLSEKLRSEMAPEEVKLYETHPSRGAEILRDFSTISAEVVAIVNDHHERPNGTGFPRKLTREKIFPLASCVAMADNLAHLIIPTRSSAEKRDLKDAIKYLGVAHSHDWDRTYWEALAKLLEEELAQKSS